MKFFTAAVISVLLCCASVSQAEIHPVVEVKSGILLGASEGRKWINARQAAKQLKSGTAFRLFDLGKEVGTAKVSKVEPDPDLCPELRIVSFTETPEQGVIAIAAPWKTLPRPVRITDTTQAAYRDAMRDFLVSRGLPKPEVKITQIVHADLDGDGEEEVLLSATNYEAEEGSAPTSARAGDYSFVLLRQSRGGKVETKLISGEFYKKNETFNAPYVHRVAAILDLDGDGKMELVLTSNYYEGGATTVYRYTPAAIKKLVEISCGA
ncbi:MAG: FG-GAP repeat protein [Chthoniobacterales bacterium]